MHIDSPRMGAAGAAAVHIRREVEVEFMACRNRFGFRAQKKPGRTVPPGGRILAHCFSWRQAAANDHVVRSFDCPGILQKAGTGVNPEPESGRRQPPSPLPQ